MSRSAADIGERDLDKLVGYAENRHNMYREDEGWSHMIKAILVKCGCKGVQKAGVNNNYINEFANVADGDSRNSGNSYYGGGGYNGPGPPAPEPGYPI